MTDSLKLTQGEMRAMMEAIWKHHGVLAALQGRSERRYGVRRGVHAVLTLRGPGGAEFTITPVLRDVSSAGVSVLHGGAVEVDTAVVCVFVEGASEPVLRVSGRVVRSRHVRGVVHEIALRFDEVIDVSTIAVMDEERPHPVHPSVAPDLAEAIGQVDQLVRTGAPIDQVVRAVGLVRAKLGSTPGTGGGMSGGASGEAPEAPAAVAA